jgi:DNA-binding HxlR family transcriptional regulator
MRTYGQYCPIARGAEIFAERWTPLIIRNVHLGCETFGEILEGAPGLSRTLLTQRLKQLERLGVVESAPKAQGRGHRYQLTSSGHDLFKVCQTLGEWGARWLEIAPENLDPFVALWSMCNALRRDRLPEQRVVIRLDFTGFRPHERYWLLLEHREAEICKTYSGLDEDLYITADAEAFVKWHAGQLSWAEATRGSRIQLDGPSWLVRAFPTWNGRSRFAHVKPDAAAVTANSTRRPTEPLPVGARFAPAAVKTKEIKGGNHDERALLGVGSLAGHGGQSRGVHPAVEGMALPK